MRRLVALLTLAAFLAQQADAATWTVSNPSDSGAGSLRTAAGNAAASDTISWSGVGSGGTINLQSTLPTINANVTLDASGADSAVTIQNAGIPLASTATFNNTTVAQPWTIVSPITGGGPLIKTGAGTLILQGANSYTGTIVNGGVLNVNSDSALGNGTLEMNGGTLQTPLGLTSGRAILLDAGNQTFDNAGSTITLTGIISGAGALIATSTGTLFLTGANSYTGGTTVRNGRLNINGDAALGASGGLTLDGGTLQAAAAFSSARAVTLTASGGTIDTNGFNVALSGGVGDGGSNGALTKIGSGVLTLSGTNTYGGGTNVNAGTLAFGGNNALPTGGSVSVASGANLDLSGFSQSNALGAVTNNGLIDAHAGTLSMGNYSGNGTLAFVMATGAAKISGAAMTLGQTTLVPTLANPVVKSGDTFTPITWTSHSGSFAAIQSPAALAFDPTYGGGGLTLTVRLIPFASAVTTPNSAAVGASLEPLRTNPTGDVATVIGQLYTLDTSHLTAALDQIGPVSLASMGGLGMTAASIHGSAISRRMSALARGETPDVSHYTVSGRSDVPGTLIASSDLSALDAPAGSDASAAGETSYFVSGLATNGRLLEGHSPSGIQPGYAFNSAGFAAGGDRRLGDHAAAGLSLGYQRGHSSVYAPGSGTADAQSLRGGAYATGFAGPAHADLYVGGAADFFNTARGIQFGSLSRTATASPFGRELNAAFNAAYDFETPQQSVFSPFWGLNYDRLMIDSFQESGADTLDLDVASQLAQSLRSALGLRVARRFDPDSHFLPYGSLAWRHEFLDQSRPIQAQLASGAGPAFGVNTGSYARDGTVIGAGCSYDWSRTTVKVDYAGDFRSHFLENTFNASVRWRF